MSPFGNWEEVSSFVEFFSSLLSSCLVLSICNRADTASQYAQFCIAGLDYKVSTWSCQWLIKWSLYVGGAGYEFCNDFDLHKPAECSLFTGATIKCESLAGGVHVDSLLDHCKVFVTNLAKVRFSIFTPNCQVGSLGWPSQIVYMGKNILVGFSCMFWNQQHFHA